MTFRRYIPASSATVVERPGHPGGLIEIPEDPGQWVGEWHCDVAVACDGGPRPRVEHEIDMSVTGPGYPGTRVEFSACTACVRLIVPNPVRLMLEQFGVDIGPGLRPDKPA